MTTTQQTDVRSGRAGSGRRIAIVALTCATAVWGWSYLATAWLLPEMKTPSLVAVRFLLAGLIMVAVRPRALGSLGRRHTLAGLGLALFLASGTLLQVEGQHFIPASQSGFLVSLFVVLTPLVSRILFRTKVTKGVWAGVVAATAGLAVISFNGVALSLGSWLTLAAALSYSVQVALLSEYSTPDKVYGLATLQILGTGVIAACWAVPAGIDLPDTAAGWGWLSYSTLLATLGMYGVQTWAQSRVSAGRRGGRPGLRTAVRGRLQPAYRGLPGGPDDHRRHADPGGDVPRGLRRPPGPATVRRSSRAPRASHGPPPRGAPGCAGTAPTVGVRPHRRGPGPPRSNPRRTRPG